jgi:hypothetical protein
MRLAAPTIVSLSLWAVGARGDLLWDNGSFDGRSGLASMRTSMWEVWTADDFIVRVAVRIEQATAEFYVDHPEGEAFELADVAIWTEPVPGDGPQDLVIELRDLPISSEKIGEAFGYDIIAATVEGLDIELEPADYFFSMRLVDYHGGWGWSLLATTGDGVLKGRDGGWLWRWPPFGWQPARNYLGYDSDFAFRLEGIPEPTTGLPFLFALVALARRR